MDREDWIVSLAFRNLVSVDKLEQLGEKFLDWKFDIKMILEALNLWDVLDPDKKVDSCGVSVSKDGKDSYAGTSSIRHDGGQPRPTGVLDRLAEQICAQHPCPQS